MVVGYESVGKTTILDCLFPLEGYLTQQGMLLKTKYWFKLQGNTLRRYEKRGDVVPHKDKVIVFENRQWEVVALPKDFGIKISPRAQQPQQPKGGSEEKEIALYCGDRETQEVWLGRLRRVCMNEATHGIEIQSHSIDNEITREYFRKPILAGKEVSENAKIDVSVWDFAGQRDYYNNHHYFISTRTVFLVLWKMSEGDKKGMRGLEFWFRSLATHLGVSSSSSASSSSSSAAEAGEGEGELAPPQTAASLSGTYYSIIVVGTFLDHPSVKKEEKAIRQKKIEGIAQECGLESSSSSSLQYYEVSCSSSLENIVEVQDGIVRTMLSHSYMGERVPKSYLTISDYLHGANEERKKREEEIAKEMKEREALGLKKGLANKSDPPTSSSGASDSQVEEAGQDIPIMKVTDLSRVYSEDLVKRALGLLSLWGECVYFESPPSYQTS